MNHSFCPKSDILSYIYRSRFGLHHIWYENMHKMVNIKQVNFPLCKMGSDNRHQYSFENSFLTSSPTSLFLSLCSLFFQGKEDSVGYLGSAANEPAIMTIYLKFLHQTSHQIQSVYIHDYLFFEIPNSFFSFIKRSLYSWMVLFSFFPFAVSSMPRKNVFENFPMKNGRFSLLSMLVI